MRRVLVAAALAAFVVVLWAPAANAHPLGNATTNQHVGLRLTPDRVHVDYVLDLAELPTYQTCEGNRCTPERASAQCAAATSNLRITVANRVAELALDRSQLRLSRGTAGLDILRLECMLTASVGVAGETTVRVENAAFPGTIGWREIIAVGDRATLVSSDVPARSASQRLTAYPDELLSSPPDLRAATIVVRPGGPALLRDDLMTKPTSPAVRSLDRFSAAYTSFIADQRSSLGFVLVAVTVSVLLGGLHALAPGHGKTVMAAYAAGTNGTRRQIATIGLTVAVTHTIGVLILGVLFTVTATAPDRVYPWLAGGSGALLLLVGIGLMRSAIRHRHPHTHDHAHDHRHGHPHHHAHPERRRLISMGLAGGLVPSPSAVLVLLGGLALGRAWLGLALVLAYGVGLAATLAGIGLLVARGRSLIDRRARTMPWLARAVPLVASSLVLLVGASTLAGAAAAL